MAGSGQGAVGLGRKRLMLWLALGSLAMWAAMVNIEKFANRPSSPVEWINARTDEAEQLANKLRVEASDQARIAEWKRDWDGLVWLFLEYGNRQKAHDEASAMPPLRPDPATYDEDYVERLQRLSRAELMHDNVADMLFTFQHLYSYDSQHLPATDLRLCRDYNNMGLACLLVGQNAGDEGLKYDYFQQSADWLKKAESGFPSGARADVLSVVENELLLAEAQKNHQLADQLRHRVDALRAELNGKAPQVTL